MKRKFRKGCMVKSIDELLHYEYFIVEYGISRRKTVHREFLLSQSVRTVQKFIEGEAAYVALRLTNGEFYEGKTDEQLAETLGEAICEYCPLPEELRGVHCYGGAPVMCEGRRCNEALLNWKEELVE